jgi:hypothetical protein
VVHTGFRDHVRRGIYADRRLTNRDSCHDPTPKMYQ